MQFITPLKAVLEFSPSDIELCRLAGNAFFESEIVALEEIFGNRRKAQFRQDRVLLRARQLSWNQQFSPSAKEDIREKVLADVLEWGAGMAICVLCDDLFLASSLNI